MSSKKLNTFNLDEIILLFRKGLRLIRVTSEQQEKHHILPDSSGYCAIYRYNPSASFLSGDILLPELETPSIHQPFSRKFLVFFSEILQIGM